MMDIITLQTIDVPYTPAEKLPPEFLYEFQRAILLSLVESGTLTELQYHDAAKQLKKPCLEQTP